MFIDSIGGLVFLGDQWIDPESCGADHGFGRRGRGVEGGRLGGYVGFGAGDKFFILRRCDHAAVQLFRCMSLRSLEIDSS